MHWVRIISMDFEGEKMRFTEKNARRCWRTIAFGANVVSYERVQSFASLSRCTNGCGCVTLGQATLSVPIDPLSVGVCPIVGKCTIRRCFYYCGLVDFIGKESASTSPHKKEFCTPCLEWHLIIAPTSQTSANVYIGATKSNLAYKSHVTLRLDFRAV